MFGINNEKLKEEAQDIARELYREGLENFDRDDDRATEYAQELAHEVAFSHEWSIYTYKALLVCAECDTSSGEEWLADIGQTFDSIGDHATAVVGATLYCLAMEELGEL